jgi:hypothetical protein
VVRPPVERPAPRPSAITRPKAAKSRRLQFVMRDGATIEGTVKAGGDQSLVAFLNTRSGWMNLTDAVRAGSGEPPGHMIIQTDHIVMGVSLDGDVGVSPTASGAGERMVELVLVGGRVVRGYVPAAEGQRLSDTIARSAKYIGVSLARLFPEGTDVGDIAIQTSALEIVRDLRGAPQENEE